MYLFDSTLSTNLELPKLQPSLTLSLRLELPMMKSYIFQNGNGISRSVDDSTAAMKTPPPRSITLISGGKIEPYHSKTSPASYLANGSAPVLPFCMVCSSSSSYANHYFIFYVIILFQQANEQSNVVANTASTSSIAVHKSQHEWPPRITLSVTQ